MTSPRGGGKWGNLPPTTDRTPCEIDADPRRFSCRKKMGVGLQDLLPRLTCTDATADVLCLEITGKKEGVVYKLWRSYFGRPSVKLRGPLGSFSPGMGPPSRTFFIYFLFLFVIVNLRPLPKNSGRNPMSFQFLIGGRLTGFTFAPPPPNLKTLTTPMMVTTDMRSPRDVSFSVSLHHIPLHKSDVVNR